MKADPVVSSIFDPLCEKYNNTFKMTSEAFKTAKTELIETVEKAIAAARQENTLIKYTEMLAAAKKIENWSRFMRFIWSEKLAREGLKVAS